MEMQAMRSAPSRARVQGGGWRAGAGGLAGVWLVMACAGACAQEGGAHPVAPAVELAAKGAAARPDAEPSAPQPADALHFDVHAYELRGSVPLPPARVTQVLAPYTGRGLTLERLRSASAALEGALRAEGLGLYRVTLPEQTLGSTVVLELVPQRIARVRVEGNTLASEAQVRNSLPGLVEGGTPNLHRLAAQSALANDSPVRHVRVVLAPVQDGEGADARQQVEARVRTAEQRPWDLVATASNHGTPATGRDRFTLAARHANLLERDLGVQAAWTTSLERPDDVRQLGLSARLPLYPLGWQLAATYIRADVVGSFGSFTSTGAGEVAALWGTTYLATGGAARHELGVGMQDRLFEATRIDGEPLPWQVHRRSRPVLLAYNGRLREPDADGGSGGRSQWGLELARNTGAGPGNDLAAYQTEDPRITGVEWYALRLTAAHARPVGGGDLGARLQLQWGSRAMIAGDQFGLGGVGTVRGTRHERPLSGDSGWFASLEWTSPARDGLRLAAFLDAGGIANRPPAGGIRPGGDGLASAGAGVRFQRGRWSVAMDYGRIIRGSRIPVDVLPSAPQLGDDRFYLSTTLSF